MTQLPNGEHVLGKNQAILPGKEVPVSFTTQQELTDFYAQLDKLSALD